MKRLIFDTEGNGLLPTITKFHCVAACDVDTGEAMEWGPNEIPQALETLEKADRLIAHNGIGFDYPALDKVCGFKVPDDKAWDSLVVARTIYPNIKELDSRFNKYLLARKLPPMGEDFGKHSIAAWGMRLKVPKLHGDITDWSTWTPDMQERCVGDVQTLLKIWKYLKPDEYSQQALVLEHRTARLCKLITQEGWPFDEKKAQALHVKLAAESEELENKLVAEFKGWTKEEPFVPKVNNKARGYVKGVPFIKKSFITFNPKSPKHVMRALKDRGWVPTEFTEKGNPKLDEEILERVVVLYPETAGLTRYLMINKRLGQLATGNKAWLKHVGPDGRIHSDYNPMGAVTSRASHFNPNIAQVPAVSSPFGHECRELFYVYDGWEEVGADMSGLEGRCFSHYLFKHDDGAYGEALLKGDPHWGVVLAVGYLGVERDTKNELHTLVREQGAKRLFYGMLYGSGDEKAGRIVLDACRMARKAFPKEGAAIYAYFFDDVEAPSSKLLKRVGSKAKRDVITGILGFEDLKNAISKYSVTGYLPGLDGRRLPVRSEHAALNTLLQSAGAIICKQWICDSYDALIAEGFTYGWNGDFVFLGWIHDELQVACRNGLGDRIGRVLTSTATKAGEPFNFRIRLDSEYKKGKTWADTH